jgi:hypothetical protein
MEEALIALLLGAPALAALTGPRVYWVRKPQTVAGRPYVVLQRIDGVPFYHMQGASDYTASRVQADVYAETYTTAKKTARALIAAISGHSGGMFQGVFVDAERDLSASDAGEVTPLFRVSVDLIIHHQS